VVDSGCAHTWRHDSLPALPDMDCCTVARGDQERAHGAANGVGEQQAVGLGGERGVAHPVGRRSLRPVQQVLRAGTQV
jgi:hypothetical protein